MSRVGLHEVEEHGVEAVAGVDADAGAGDVADDDVDAGAGGAEVDGGHGAELWGAFFVGDALPFGLGGFCVLLGGCDEGFVDAFDEGMGVAAGGDGDFDFVPHPLADGGEIEIFSADSVAVEE